MWKSPGVVSLSLLLFTALLWSVLVSTALLWSVLVSTALLWIVLVSMQFCGVSQSPLQVCGVSRSPLHFCGVSLSPLHFCGVSRSPVYFCGVSRSLLHFCGVSLSPLQFCGVSRSPVYFRGVVMVSTALLWSAMPLLLLVSTEFLWSLAFSMQFNRHTAVPTIQITSNCFHLPVPQDHEKVTSTVSETQCHAEKYHEGKGRWSPTLKKTEQRMFRVKPFTQNSLFSPAGAMAAHAPEAFVCKSFVFTVLKNVFLGGWVPLYNGKKNRLLHCGHSLEKRRYCSPLGNATLFYSGATASFHCPLAACMYCTSAFNFPPECALPFAA